MDDKKLINGYFIDRTTKGLDNVVKITILLALAGIPLVFVPLGGQADHFYLPKVVAMITLVLSFLILLIINKIKISSIIHKDNINKSLLIYLMLVIVSVIIAENKDLAIYGIPGRYEGIITIFLYMFLFLIARIHVKADKKLFMIVLIAAVIVSVYGILQTFGLDPFVRDMLRENWSSRAFSTMGNPNFLGSYLVLMIPISIYIYIINKDIIGLITYAILFYSLLSTNTRGAWLGTIASIIAFVIIHFIYFRFNKDEFIKYIVLFVVTLIIMFVYYINTDGAFLDRLFTITDDAKELLTNGERSDFTGAHRGFIWKRVLELIKARPLTGYGIENLGEVFQKYYTKDMIDFWGEVRYPDKAHNEYLHIAVSSGIPSLVVYLIFLFQTIRIGLYRLKSCKINLLLLSSVIGYITAAFFNISVVSVAYVYWIFLGLIAGDKLNKLN